MMTVIEILLQILMPVALLVLLIFCAINLLKLRFELNAYAENLIHSTMGTEQYNDTDLRRMFDRRLTMFEARITKLIEQQQATVSEAKLAPVPPLKNELPVEYAARMARAGASVDDLVQSCGLNVGEAQLLLRLHASRRAPARAVRH